VASRSRLLAVTNKSSRVTKYLSLWRKKAYQRTTARGAGRKLQRTAVKAPLARSEGGRLCSASHIFSCPAPIASQIIWKRREEKEGGRA